MKTSSHFSSKHSTLILGSILTASVLFAGVTLAQTLTIPTDLRNAAITIQKIFLSTSGTAKDSEVGVKISLDGDTGNITLSWGDLILKKYPCALWSGCILKVDTAGKVITSETGADEGVFKRTVGDTTARKRNNIYLALENGEATVAGEPSTTQSFLRVGAGDKTNDTAPEKDDTAIVAGGVIESRGGLYIKKFNADAELSNSPNNQKTDITRNFTSLDLNTTEGKVNFRSNKKESNSTNSPTSFIFSADGASTKLGINTAGTPEATLDVVGSTTIAGNTAVKGTLLLGMDNGDLEDPDLGGTTSMIVGGDVESRGTLSVKQANNGSTSTAMDQSSNYTALDISTNNGNVQFNATKKLTINNQSPTTFSFINEDFGDTKISINSNTANKTLDVNGDAAITDAMTIGFASTESAGTDKLKVNGSTRADAYYYNSDRRYKSDIVALKSPLANLLKISGYSYYSKLEKKDTIGVIAQEVETVYPELVQTDAAWYKSVQYGNLIAPIIEAIKELSAKIDSLFTLYVSQQAKIDTLEERLLNLYFKSKVLFLF